MRRWSPTRVSSPRGKPDIPDFCRKMIEEFAEDRHQRAAE